MNSIFCGNIAKPTTMNVPVVQCTSVNEDYILKLKEEVLDDANDKVDPHVLANELPRVADGKFLSDDPPQPLVSTTHIYPAGNISADQGNASNNTRDVVGEIAFVRIKQEPEEVEEEQAIECGGFDSSLIDPLEISQSDGVQVKKETLPWPVKEEKPIIFSYGSISTSVGAKDTNSGVVTICVSKGLLKNGPSEQEQQSNLHFGVHQPATLTPNSSVQCSCTESQVGSVGSQFKIIRPKPPVQPTLQDDGIAQPLTVNDATCELCYIQLNSPKQLKVHLRCIHSVYTCRYCLKTFKSYLLLLMHMSSYMVCMVCKTKFGTQKELADHRRLCHFPPYVCNACSTTVESHDLLLEHYSIAHSKTKCSICTKVYSTKKLCIRHELSHEDLNDNCLICMCFIVKGSRRKHFLLSHVKFECPTCHLRVDSKDALDRHTSLHASEYWCDGCKGCFQTYAELDEHVVSQHKCRHCDLHFPSPKVRAHHEALHLNKVSTVKEVIAKQTHQAGKSSKPSPSGVSSESDPRKNPEPLKQLTKQNENEAEVSDDDSDLNCKLCNLKLSNAKQLKIHFRCVHSRFTCRYCLKPFKSYLSLLMHMTSYPVCMVCKLMLPTQKDLANHRRTCHLSKFECSLCSTTSPSHEELVQHYTAIHSKFKCSICTNLYNVRTSCKQHELSHEKSSNNCFICMCFIVKVSMKKHFLVSHVRFQCSTCLLRVDTQDAFDKHTSLHKNEYWCHVCKDCFHTDDELKEHIVLQHKCGHCEMYFSSPRNRNYHFNVSHPRNFIKGKDTKAAIAFTSVVKVNSETNPVLVSLLQPSGEPSDGSAKATVDDICGISSLNKYKCHQKNQHKCEHNDMHVSSSNERKYTSKALHSVSVNSFRDVTYTHNTEIQPECSSSGSSSCSSSTQKPMSFGHSCKFCYIYFQSSNECERHFLQIHYCILCQLLFPRPFDLKAHQYAKHNGKFQCALKKYRPIKEKKPCANGGALLSPRNKPTNSPMGENSTTSHSTRNASIDVVQDHAVVHKDISTEKCTLINNRPGLFDPSHQQIPNIQDEQSVFKTSDVITCIKSKTQNISEDLHEKPNLGAGLEVDHDMDDGSNVNILDNLSVEKMDEDSDAKSISEDQLFIEEGKEAVDMIDIEKCENFSEDTIGSYVEQFEEIAHGKKVGGGVKISQNAKDAEVEDGPLSKISCHKICSQRFQLPDEVGLHTAPPSKASFACTHCHLMFSTEMELASHSECEHTEKCAHKSSKVPRPVVTRETRSKSKRLKTAC